MYQQCLFFIESKLHNCFLFGKWQGKLSSHLWHSPEPSFHWRVTVSEMMGLSCFCALCRQPEVGRTVVMQLKLYMEHEVSWPHSLLLTVSSSIWICLWFKFPEYHIDSCCNTLTCAHPGIYYFMASWYALSLPTALVCIQFIMANPAEKLLCFICFIFHKSVDGRGDIDLSYQF